MPTASIICAQRSSNLVHTDCGATHLDADEAVKGVVPFGGDVAIVEEVDANLVGQTRVGNALLGELLLL
jgi:hypothetical protein